MKFIFDFLIKTFGNDHLKANWENISHFDEEPPLIKAAWEGDINSVRFHLENGTDIETKNKCHSTALILASEKKDNVEVIRLLLDRGAYVDAKNNCEVTALYMAISGNHKGNIKLLIEYGAHIDSKEFKEYYNSCDDSFREEIRESRTKFLAKGMEKEALYIYELASDILSTHGTYLSLLPLDVVSSSLSYLAPSLVETTTNKIVRSVHDELYHKQEGKSYKSIIDNKEQQASNREITIREFL